MDDIIRKKMKLIQKLVGLFKNNLYQNTIYNIGAKGIAMILYMLVDIGIARIVSVSEYGEWFYFYSLISMVFWIAWFGVNSSARVYIAQFSPTPHLQVQYLKASVVLRIIVSIGSVIIYYFVVFCLKEKILLMDTYPNLLLLLMVGGVLVFFSSLSEFFKEINIGLARFKSILIISCLEFGGYLIFGVGLLLFAKYVFMSEQYIVGILIGYIISLMIVTVYGFSTIKVKIKNNMPINYGFVVEVLKYAIPILVMSFGALITLELDTVMIGSIFEGEQVAVYSVAKKICSKAAHISIAVCTATMTEFAILNRENIREKKNLFKRLMWINGGITFVLIGIFVCIVPFFIVYFYGESYRESYKVLYWLSPYFIMNNFSFFMANLMDYQKKAKLRSIFYIIMLALDIILNAVWIPRYGAIGAAWATSLSIVPYFCFLILETVRLFYSYERE